MVSFFCQLKKLVTSPDLLEDGRIISCCFPPYSYHLSLSLFLSIPLPSSLILIRLPLSAQMMQSPSKCWMGELSEWHRNEQQNTEIIRRVTMHSQSSLKMNFHNGCHSNPMIPQQHFPRSSKNTNDLNAFLFLVKAWAYCKSMCYQNVKLKQRWFVFSQLTSSVLVCPHLFLPLASTSGSSLSFTGPPLFNQIALLSVNVDVTGSGQIGHSPLCNMAGADKSPVEMLIKMATPAIKSDWGGSALGCGNHNLTVTDRRGRMKSFSGTSTKTQLMVCTKTSKGTRDMFV